MSPRRPPQGQTLLPKASSDFSLIAPHSHPPILPWQDPPQACSPWACAAPSPGASGSSHAPHSAPPAGGRCSLRGTRHTARSWSSCGPCLWGGGLVLRGRVQRQAEELPPTPTLLCPSAPTPVSSPSNPPLWLHPHLRGTDVCFLQPDGPLTSRTLSFSCSNTPPASLGLTCLQTSLWTPPPLPCLWSWGPQWSLAVPSPRVLASLRSVPAVCHACLNPSWSALGSRPRLPPAREGLLRLPPASAWLLPGLGLSHLASLPVFL